MQKHLPSTYWCKDKWKSVYSNILCAKMKTVETASALLQAGFFVRWSVLR